MSSRRENRPLEVPYDAILIVSFGGPESRDDVIPFLENVLRGRNVPRERMLEVVEHYYQFDGKSPINGQVRALIAALQTELERLEIDLPIYWGNRNWHPLLKDTLGEMTAAGVKRALAFMTSAYSSYSGCRQYREDVERAQNEVGGDSLEVEKLRMFYNHPDFIAANVDCLKAAVELVPEDRRDEIHVAFTAHSIPASMATSSDYEQQLSETCRLVSEQLGFKPEQWDLVYQSRSGRPTDPWLEPDILDHLQGIQKRGCQNVIVQPIGFLSDHLEVLFDLDREAQDTAKALGMTMTRAATVGTHPQFIKMIGKLILERLQGTVREATGCFGPNHDSCPAECCPAPARPAK